MVSIDLSAPTPLACIPDPTDNTRISHVAPGQLITLFGDDFSDGVNVSVDGFPAPLLYASTQQINTQVPVELADRDVVTLAVQMKDGAALSRPLLIVPRAPSAFLMLQDLNLAGPFVTCKGASSAPACSPVARNADGSLNRCDAPAAPGSKVTFYLNGIGATNPTVKLLGDSPGALVGIEQDPDSPSGVWRLQLQLPSSVYVSFLDPLIDGVPLRKGPLAVWMSGHQ